MLSNYIKVAFRNIARNKLYAVINIIGLSMGLALYIFGGLLSDYEHSHGTMFKNHDRTYTLRSEIIDGNNLPIIFSAAAPIIKAELSELDAIARTKTREILVTYDENSYYQTLRFADPELFEIFNFEFIYGNESALNNSSNIVITASIAKKYFKDENPLGHTITLNNRHSAQIGAVINDVPKNSHFNSSIYGRPLEIFVPIQMMEYVTNYDPDKDWQSMQGHDVTYVMLPNTLNQEWLQLQMNGIFERHYPSDAKEYVKSILVYPLIAANTAIWDNYGIPAIVIISALGQLVLVIACLNYANLATAQSMGRVREVGLRKTLGAQPLQLLQQFVIESITLTIFAMIVTLASLEILIPLFNNATGKVMSLDYVAMLPQIALITIVVGLISGAYPSYLITKINPIDALKDGPSKEKSATWVRSIMIGVQFTISVFMLAMLTVVFTQNKNMVESSKIFAKDQIYILDRLDVVEIKNHHESIRNEMLVIDGVDNFTFSSQVPFEDYTSRFRGSKSSTDLSSIMPINEMGIDQEYLNIYDVELLAGRNISTEIALDSYAEGRFQTNVIINELAADKFGFASPQEAVGKVFFEDDSDGLETYIVVGVVKDQNIYGLQSEIRPFTFMMKQSRYRHASIKLSSSATPKTIREIEETWKRIIPEYPIQARFLDERFEEAYRLFDLSAKTLTGFAIFSLVLALIGLFGLSAFMAEQRTKEIGIRKVLGATSNQIITLLIWQFSKPVLWATPFALALAYLASNSYLEFFGERIGLPYGLLLVAGLCGLMLSWLTVAMHAYNVARTNPINALHYE